MNIWRYILFPFAWLYGLLLKIRHFLFDKGILKSKEFDIPVIGVGNLSLGGTGKTPMVEYLIGLLKDYRIAVLSRGYGRKTSGFVLANQYTTASHIGDEPLQYFKKFGKKIIVAVDEKRARGIKKLLQYDNNIDVILLDDSFQHRHVKPGINILLTNFHNLYVDDHLIPVGTLRDLKISAKRADIITVTKTDIVLSPIVERDILKKLNPLPHQKVYFSFIKYKEFVPVPDLDIIPLEKKDPTVIVLFTGIANSWPLVAHLKTKCSELITLKFKDHHNYTLNDIDTILNKFDDQFSKNKILLTTEKDVMRLINSPYFSRFNKKPFYYLPIKSKIHKNEKEEFKTQILEYVRKNKRNR
jgi:tetraacyldisaccharide 4'-kinase